VKNGDEAIPKPAGVVVNGQSKAAPADGYDEDAEAPCGRARKLKNGKERCSCHYEERQGGEDTDAMRGGTEPDLNL